jgi:branched-chain amino acid transport system substrate-binding protein
VSDLPLQDPTAPAAQMSAAIVYVLREHDFRAGRFDLGYQSCDDSTPEQAGMFDPGKCASNAYAWARGPLVIGVVGPYNSGCAEPEISITNKAGPLAMISPTNSWPGLTRPDLLAPPGFLHRLYPTGIRNYAHVYPADDVEAAGMAEFARLRKLDRVYVLYDGKPAYGDATAHYFQMAAKRLGLRLAGSSAWYPPTGPGVWKLKRIFTQLASRVARSRATAVYVGATAPNIGGGALIRALHQQLGTRVTVLSNENNIPTGPLFQFAGSAARGVYIATSLALNGPLGSAARQFVTRFAATRPGAPVNAAVLYAAQATDVLLNAIARSDGTRRSVTHALLSTCVHNGILGSFCFDASGEPTATPVAILQVKRPGGVMDFDTSGTDVAAVIDTPDSMVR